MRQTQKEEAKPRQIAAKANRNISKTSGLSIGKKTNEEMQQDLVKLLRNF